MLISKHPKTIIPRKEDFFNKLKKIRLETASKLHFVVDFDRTLTKEFLRGKRLPVSYDPTTLCLTKESQKQEEDMLNYYYPLEHSNISPKEKIRLMDEWWEKSFDNLIRNEISENEYRSKLRNTKLIFRKGTKEFFHKLNQNGIPVLIFSGGVGNTIEYYMKQQKLMNNNVHIISNFIIFRNGKAASYTTPLIHTFTKDERHIRSEAYKQAIKKRKNIILIGDSIGDITMANGLMHKQIIKIGFLNHDTDKRIGEYSQIFDAIITQDDDFSFINQILTRIL